MSGLSPTADRAQVAEQLRLFPVPAGPANDRWALPCRIDGCPDCARWQAAADCCVGSARVIREAGS